MFSSQRVKKKTERCEYDEEEEEWKKDEGRKNANNRYVKTHRCRYLNARSLA